MSIEEREKAVLSELSLIIGRHAEWLDGRTFQRLAQQTAEGYFPASDLDQYESIDGGGKLFMELLRRELHPSEHIV